MKRKAIWVAMILVAGAGCASEATDPVTPVQYWADGHLELAQTPSTWTLRTPCDVTEFPRPFPISLADSFSVVSTVTPIRWMPQTLQKFRLTGATYGSVIRATLELSENGGPWRTTGTLNLLANQRSDFSGFLCPA